ncbi:MAG: hypothetical protein SNF93_00670 [Rikenellaceae bacterium]
MRREYFAPQIEVIEIELEDVILSGSGDVSVEGFYSGSSIGDDSKF